MDADVEAPDTSTFATSVNDNTGEVSSTQEEQVCPQEETSNQLSKRKLRKLEKFRYWQETKHLRKEKRRRKKQEYKEKKRQRLDVLKSEATAKGLDPSEIYDHTNRKRLKTNSMKNSLCKVGICVDMSFNDLMIDKDLQKCVKQVHRCYGLNRRFPNPVQFHVTSFTGKAVEVMNRNDGWKNWDVHIHEKSFLELDSYPKDKIVYLTAESENVLKELDDSTLYVIGGLVDHNSRKGLCHSLAVEKGLKHARLPLDEYVDMKVRRVLSIIHVFQIVGNVAQKRPWQEAIMEALPQRTNAKLKEDGNSDDDNGNSEGENPAELESREESEHTAN